MYRHVQIMHFSRLGDITHQLFVACRTHKKADWWTRRLGFLTSCAPDFSLFSLRLISAGPLADSVSRLSVPHTVAGAGSSLTYVTQPTHLSVFSSSKLEHTWWRGRQIAKGAFFLCFFQSFFEALRPEGDIYTTD